MQLTPQRLAEFDDKGYIFLPSSFSADEVALMRDEGAKQSSTVHGRQSGARRLAREDRRAYPREIVYLTLCACSNRITKFTRAEWIAHRDFTCIVPVDDGALAEYARVRRVAAE